MWTMRDLYDDEDLADDFGMDSRDLLVLMREGDDTDLDDWDADLHNCDFCSNVVPGRELYPEEGGAWACKECLDRWDAQGASSPHD